MFNDRSFMVVYYEACQIFSSKAVWFIDAVLSL